MTMMIDDDFDSIESGDLKLLHLKNLHEVSQLTPVSH